MALAHARLPGRLPVSTLVALAAVVAPFAIFAGVTSIVKQQHRYRAAPGSTGPCGIDPSFLSPLLRCMASSGQTSWAFLKVLAGPQLPFSPLQWRYPPHDLNIMVYFNAPVLFLASIVICCFAQRAPLLQRVPWPVVTSLAHVAYYTAQASCSMTGVLTLVTSWLRLGGGMTPASIWCADATTSACFKCCMRVRFMEYATCMCTRSLQQVVTWARMDACVQGVVGGEHAAPPPLRTPVVTASAVHTVEGELHTERGRAICPPHSADWAST